MLTNNEVADPSNPAHHLRFQSLLKVLNDLDLQLGRDYEFVYQGLKKTEQPDLIHTQVRDELEFKRGQETLYYSQDYRADVTTIQRHDIKDLRSRLAGNTTPITYLGIGNSAFFSTTNQTQTHAPTTSSIPIGERTPHPQ